jgi:hypothetical protein
MTAAMVATVATRATLPAARVIAGSLARWNPGIPCAVLLADEERGALDPARERFDLVRWNDLDTGGARRDTWLRFRHDEHALACAATPFLLAHLLGRGFDRVLFLKSESLVTGDLGPLFARLERASILLTPHLLAPLAGDAAAERELEVLLAGAYNGGVLGIASGENARRFLAWWSERVALDCRHAVAEGLHFEQRWLDLVPSYFEGVEVVHEPGANVGHWALPERRIVHEAGAYTAAGEPLRVFRASGHDPATPRRATRYSPRLALAETGATTELFEAYRTALLEAGWEAARGEDHAWNRFASGVAIPAVARRLHRELGEDAERFGDPFDDRGDDSFAAYLRSPAGPRDSGEGVRISRLWLAIYEERGDVARAFPDPFGADHRAFVDWTRTSGCREHGVPPELA